VDRMQAVRLLEQKRQLDSSLASAPDEQELSRLILRYANEVLPLQGANLYMGDALRRQMTRSPRPAPGEIGTGDGPAQFDDGPCRACAAERSGLFYPLDACQQPEVCARRAGQGAICFPLTRGSQIVGLLHFSLLPGQAAGSQDLLPLINVSAEMSGALLNAMEKKAREESAKEEAIHAVQLDLARDLHDTIGQNISYLKLKLDLLTMLSEESQPAPLADLDQMSRVADETLDMVRGMLSVLKSGSSADLMGLLKRYAEQVQERSGLQVEMASRGLPRSLNPKQIRHLFYIFREGLSNVEKHAGASQVRVSAGWEEELFALSIEDNGCGFDPTQVETDHHYGLQFMRERVGALHGSLAIHSRPGEGTRIALSIPYENGEQRAGTPQNALN
jgi:two-component system, NarL family, sensor histidine kinase UhpB